MTDRPGYIAFFRHGAYSQRAGVPSARQPYGLTPDGMDQARDGARALSDLLGERGLALAPTLYSSRQLRAWQTARIIGDTLADLGHHVGDIVETSDLAERGLGSAANLSVDDINRILACDPRYPAPPPGWKSDSDYCLPLEGAESLMEAGRRVAGYLQKNVSAGYVTVMVGHGASYRHACHHLGILQRSQIAALSMYHARLSLICHNGHGTWDHLAGAWKIRDQRDDPKD